MTRFTIVDGHHYEGQSGVILGEPEHWGTLGTRVRVQFDSGAIGYFKPESIKIGGDMEQEDPEIQIVSVVNTGALSDQLTFYLSDEQMVDFIKKLDQDSANWSVTEALYRYFKKQHKQFKKENKDES